MIYLIGKTEDSSSKFQYGTWDLFVKWMLARTEFEFDIETTMSNWWSEKYLITLQFGEVYSGEDPFHEEDQWLLQWSELSPIQRQQLKSLLENPKWKKLIHNAMFECVVLRFHGIILRNIYDTMLTEKVLYGGDQTTTEYSLYALCLKYENVELDKTEQTNFGDNILTESKIIYACQDVQYLSSIREKQNIRAEEWKLYKVIELENDVVPAFAEMIFYGMRIDKEAWRKLQYEAEPLVAAAEEKLNQWLLDDSIKMKAYALNYLRVVDTIRINWNSPKQKTTIFKDLFPSIPGTTKAILKKHISDLIKSGKEVPEWLNYCQDGDYVQLEEFIVENYRDWLIENGLLVPAGTPMINWNSTDQVLPIMQCVEPKLKAMNAEAKARCSHPIILDYDDYLDTAKLISTYGEAFLSGSEEKGKTKKLPKVEPDDRVRTNFNQVLVTGRVSSSNPKVLGLSNVNYFRKFGEFREVLQKRG